jgi:hypothetical protein
MSFSNTTQFLNTFVRRAMTKTAAILDSNAIPTSADDHKDVQRHVRQRKELDGKLHAAEERQAALVAERDQLRRARHDHEVAVLLGEGGGDEHPDHTARLTQVESEIVAADATLAAVRDALERHAVLAAGTRQQVEEEIRRQHQAAAHAVVRKMLPLAEDLMTLNKQLIDIGERSPITLLAPPPALLIAWMEQARGVLRG